MTKAEIAKIAEATATAVIASLAAAFAGGEVAAAPAEAKPKTTTKAKDYTEEEIRKDALKLIKDDKVSFDKAALQAYYAEVSVEKLGEMDQDQRNAMAQYLKDVKSGKITPATEDEDEEI